MIERNSNTVIVLTDTECRKDGNQSIQGGKIVEGDVPLQVRAEVNRPGEFYGDEIRYEAFE